MAYFSFDQDLLDALNEKEQRRDSSVKGLLYAQHASRVGARLVTADGKNWRLIEGRPNNGRPNVFWPRSGWMRKTDLHNQLTARLSDLFDLDYSQVERRISANMEADG